MNLDLDRPHLSDPSKAPDISSPADRTTVPKNILAFHTITTLLSSLQEAAHEMMNITSNHANLVNPKVKQESRILAVLATLLVRKYKVIAVVALHSEPQQRGYLNTIASVHVNDGKEQPKTSLGRMGSIGSWEWDLLVTQNFRRDNDQLNGSLGAWSQDMPIVPVEGLDSDLFWELHITVYVQSKTF